MDLYDAASKITTLVALQQFVSAFDPTYCCPKPTKVKFHRAATGSPRPLTFSDVESHEVLFHVHDKSLSLHKERTVLDGRNGVPVATLRTALLHRTPTYEAFARTETEDTPETFQFSIESGRKVRIDFHDLVGGLRECVGGDPVAVEGESGASALEFWLVRGKDDVRQAIARVHYSADGEGVLEVAKGVDLMMMVLVCIALESHKEKTASP